MITDTGLRAVSERVLEDLAQDADYSFVIKAVLTELIIRVKDGELDVDDWDLEPLLEKLVRTVIQETWEDVYFSCQELWPDNPGGPSKRLFAAAITEVTKQFGNIDKEELPPWPTTEPPAKPGGGSWGGADDQSALNILGYRVGKTNGLSIEEREYFLSYFFRNDLPQYIHDIYEDSYGAPGAVKRLMKMANLLAGLCVTRKLSDPHKYRNAIADWEHDLAFLNTNFYKSGSFPWPPTDG